jgi:voltage-gated potassium channel
VAAARETAGEKTLNKNEDSLLARAWEAFRLPIYAALAIEVVGTLGYRLLSGGSASYLDCLYMTWMTVTTVGFGEHIDMTGNPVGRVFTMAIGTAGIANIWYSMSKLTVFIVESRFDEVMRRRKMQDRIDHMSGHYVLCGVGRVGSNVAQELVSTGRQLVAVDESVDAVALFRERYPNVIALHGDASDDDLLAKAGASRAAGVFAVTGDDGKNLLITLSAKQINPKTRVVARCHEVRNIEKLKRIGADAIVSPDFTGGMRIASSMLRPTVVTFLDEMLRSDDKLRVEEAQVPGTFTPRSIRDTVPASVEFVILAVRMGSDWQFNPPQDFTLQPGNILVVMTTQEGRRMVASALGA